MKLNLDTLPPGRSELPVTGTYRLDLEEGDAGEVTVSGELRVDATEGRVLVRGDLRVAGTAECDRCLSAFALSYVADVDIVIVRDARGGDPADDAEEGTAWTEHQARGEVDLAPALKEAALLTLPQKMVCREDCRGICAHCGVDRNVEACDCDQEITDPRWDALPS